VHGSFDDHRSNWEFVRPLFEKQFTVHAVAQRGRGETDATTGHSLEDEGRDVTAVIQAVGEPVFLLGHSYGAQVSLAAAVEIPDRVRRLVLYEPPWPHILAKVPPQSIEPFAQLMDQAVVVICGAARLTHMF
jgi:pimeloyl-ACP methyl ester carboxylesterase